MISRFYIIFSGHMASNHTYEYPSGRIFTDFRYARNMRRVSMVYAATVYSFYHLLLREYCVQVRVIIFQF